MSTIEYKYWMVRSAIPRDNSADAAAAQSNNCVAVQGWPDSQIISYLGQLTDGWVRSEFQIDQDEAGKLKNRKNITLSNIANQSIIFSGQDEVNAWLQILQHTTFQIGDQIKIGSQYNLLITNTSGGSKDIIFASNILVDHESALAGNDGALPNNNGAYLEFRGMPSNKLLLTRLLVRSI